MILRRFHSFPIFLELTLHWQKTQFSIFLSSGTQTMSKWPENLRGSFFGRKKAYERKRRRSGGLRARMDRTTRPDSWAVWDPPFWASWLCLRRSFFPKLPRDLKTTIKIAPRCFPEESAVETQKHRNREVELQIGEGKLRRGVDGGIDESILLPQLRQQILLIPWKGNNI